MSGPATIDPHRPVHSDSGARRGGTLDVLLLFLGIALPLLSHVGAPPLPTFVLAVLLSGWLPGRAAVRFFGLERHPVRWALAVGMSLAVTVAVSLILATVSFVNFGGSLQIFWYVAIVLPFALTMFRRPPAESASARESAAGAEAGASPVGGPTLTGALRDPGLWIAVALTACWGLGLSLTKASALGPYGFLPVYSVLYWIGFVGLAGWLVWRAVRIARTPDIPFGLGLASLVFALHLPGIVLSSAPRFTWLYKHLGVIDYITAHKVVDNHIDVYHNWPGFFAYASWLNRLTGATSLEYAAWMPVAVNLAAVALCSALYRQLAIPRIVRRLALVLVVVSNWIGEDYFSPQGMAYVMHISLILCCVVGFGGGRLRRWIRVPRRLASGMLPTGLPSGPSPVRRPTIFLALMVVASWVMVATHQLTPLFFLAELGLAALVGVWRTWRITIIGGAVFGAYYLWHLQYIKDKYNVSINLNPLENAGGTTAELVTVTSPGAHLAGSASTAMVAFMFAIGAVGFVVGLRRGIPVLSQAVLALSPVGVFLVQSYGGEALYRVVMFSQLGLAPLVALALIALARHGRSRLGLGLVMALVMGVAVGFQPAHYANERVLRVTAAEVRASQWLANRPAGSMVYFANDAFPARINARYIQHIPGKGQYDPVLTSIVPELENGRLPGPRIVPQVQQVLQYTTPRQACSYIVFSPSQLAQVQTYGPTTPRQYERLKVALQKSPNYRTVYSSEGVEVLKNTKLGNGDPSQVPGAVTTPQKSCAS